MENTLTGNERGNSKEQGFFQKYKTELIIAGVTVAAVVGTVLIAKNWDSIVGLAKNWSAPKKPVVLEKVISSTSMKSEVLSCRSTAPIPSGKQSTFVNILAIYQQAVRHRLKR